MRERDWDCDRAGQNVCALERGKVWLPDEFFGLQGALDVIWIWKEILTKCENVNWKRMHGLDKINQ